MLLVGQVGYSREKLFNSTFNPISKMCFSNVYEVLNRASHNGRLDLYNPMNTPYQDAHFFCFF